MAKIINHHQALIYIMVTMSGVDGLIGEKELKRIGRIVEGFGGLIEGTLLHGRLWTETGITDGKEHVVMGRYTLAVLPLTLVVNLILYRFQRRRVFNLLGLRVRRNAAGFVGFVLAYQMLMSPIAVVGYGQELLGLRRRWK